MFPTLNELSTTFRPRDMFDFLKMEGVSYYENNGVLTCENEHFSILREK